MTLSKDPRSEIDALFAAALAHDGAERDAFLADLAMRSPMQAVEVDELLRLVDVVDPRLEHRIPAIVLQDLFATDADASARGAGVGHTIGTWHLQHLIGEGGMGEVYHAKRSHGDFEQYGALKRLRAGVDSREFLRRFALERQILASLRHPGIARLLDGGRDNDGRPYLVMEFVDGLAIDRYCDAQRLDVSQRIRLFLQVARAVADAHRHLIVHRDIKPSNVHVDGDGFVKLLDFGIAKVLSDADQLHVTNDKTAAMLFTPEYATPEQILGDPVTTATDVYQLGLLLYELLTGQRAQRVENTTLIGLERAICATSPPLPSETTANADELTCAARASTRAVLRRRLRGDLDQIVLKALRKDPGRRYGSAQELVDDLDRWTQGMPVRARAETFAYRGTKFVHRHPLGVAAALAMVILLVGWAASATLQARTIAKERDSARLESAKSKQVQSLLVQLFAGADPERSGGTELSARELLDRGWKRIEDGPDLAADVRAELLDTVGEAYRQLGIFDRAANLFDQALALSALAPNERLALARALRSSGRVKSDQSDYASAARQLDEALSIYRKQSGPDSIDIADTLSDIGLLQNRKGDFAMAAARYEESLAMRRRLFGESHPAVAESLDELGMMKRIQGDYAGAEPLLSRALELRRQLLPASHPHLARSLSNVALVRNDLGDSAGAEALYREAIALMQHALGENHPQLAIVENNLAKVLQLRRDFAGARILLEQALSIRRKALGDQHPMVALNLNDLGLLCWEMGDYTGAERYYADALAVWPADHPWRSATVFNVARLAETRGNYAAAERTYREVIALQSKEYGPEHDRVAIDLNRLGIVLHRQGHLDEAEASMRQALAIYRKRLPAGHQRFATILVPLAALLIDRGNRSEAETLLVEALQARQHAFGDEDPRTREVLAALEASKRQSR